MNLVDRLSEWIVGGILFSLIFVLSRKLWLWYWRIPEIEKDLREIAATLKRIERRGQTSGT